MLLLRLLLCRRRSGDGSRCPVSFLGEHCRPRPSPTEQKKNLRTSEIKCVTWQGAVPRGFGPGSVGATGIRSLLWSWQSRQLVSTAWRFTASSWDPRDWQTWAFSPSGRGPVEGWSTWYSSVALSAEKRPSPGCHDPAHLRPVPTGGCCSRQGWLVWRGAGRGCPHSCFLPGEGTALALQKTSRERPEAAQGEPATVQLPCLVSVPASAGRAAQGEGRCEPSTRAYRQRRPSL